MRSLDFFFAKQNQALPSKEQTHQTTDTDAVTENSQEKADHDQSTETLTDEQLARKLQQEWNEENQSSDGKEAVVEDSKLAPVHTAIHVSSIKSKSVIPLERKASPNQSRNAVDVQAREDSKIDLDNGRKATLTLQSAVSAEDVICSTIPFDENPLTFKPSDYLPLLKKHWAVENGDASYALLTRCFILVNSTQSRIKIVDTLVNLVRTIIEGHPDSLLPAVRLSSKSRCILLC